MLMCGSGGRTVDRSHLGARVLLSAGLVATSVLASPRPAAPQDSAAREATASKIGCFRGRPLPECKSFWIVELAGLWPLAQTSREVTFLGGNSSEEEAFGLSGELNIGHMVNLSDRIAVGGSISVGSGTRGTYTRIVSRARRWMSSDWSVEASAGLLRTNAGYAPNQDSGATAGVRVNIRDEGSFFIRGEILPMPERRTGDYRFDPGGTQKAVSAGVALGSVPALVGVGSAGVIWAVLIGVLLASGVS